ncbi:MAG: hypothetical protein D6696_01705 [Acidobacteria bacterium]|nr:MAG: hypothetical protein D6696_01705 [Acidobacteriota bacterium]
MSRAVAHSLLALSLFLSIVPLVLPKPGLPASLKADEPAYLLAALSLAFDGDLRCETRDLLRAFDDFPYVTSHNLILASDDGWHTLTFGKPFLYSLAAAPFVALAGANGMTFFNMLLFVAMLWMGTDYLRRHNGSGEAALFCAGFLFLSNAFVYVFWLHPEVFLMAAGMACLYFGLEVAGREVERGAPWWRWPLDPRAAPAISAACLACAVYHKPMMAALGVPVLVHLGRARRLKDAAAWLASAVLVTALIAGTSWLLAGYPSAYLVDARAGFPIESPDRPPVEPERLAPVERQVLEERAAGWWWIFRLPDLHWGELRENVTYFVAGRHTGLVLYQPFAVIALGLFLLHGRRSVERWLILAALAAVALSFLLWIPFNWHGGGGFVGNRYFVVVYPAFLFLVTRLRPAWTILAGYAAGGLILGPLVLAPFGAIVPQGTLQAHARSRAFQLFPYELSLKEIPGHHGVVVRGLYVLGRKDQMRVIDDVIWTQGADRVELWLQSAVPLAELAFEVRSQAPENHVAIELEDARASLDLGGRPERVVLAPSRPTKVRSTYQPGSDERVYSYAYRMVVESRTGELPAWRGGPAHTFYLGAGLRYLGPAGDGEPDVPQSG